MASPLGSFPITGPTIYLTDDPLQCSRLMEGPRPSESTWFHGTNERAARLSCVQGIAPGCWIRAGGECCGVMGFDSLDSFLGRKEHLWIVEVVGPAISGDLKAWWVPPTDVVGIWHLGTLSKRQEIAATCSEQLAEPMEGCSCPLSDICFKQQDLWRSTWKS